MVATTLWVRTYTCFLGGADKPDGSKPSECRLCPGSMQLENKALMFSSSDLQMFRKSSQHQAESLTSAESVDLCLTGLVKVRIKTL